VLRCDVRRDDKVPVRVSSAGASLVEAAAHASGNGYNAFAKLRGGHRRWGARGSGSSPFDKQGVDPRIL
jgi:hypothetical protein